MPVGDKQLSCSACGSSVRAGDRHCSGCGMQLGAVAVPVREPERAPFPFWGYLLIGIGIFIAVCIISDSGKPSDSRMDATKEARFQLALGGAIHLRAAMRDPTSFHVSSALVTQNDKAVCYQFRAANGFGGVDTSWAVLSPDGFREQGTAGFDKSWKKNCDGQKGYDLSGDIRIGLEQYNRQLGD